MKVTDAADWALDKTIVGGYSSAGYALRRHWWPADPPADALRGRRALVTGAAGGLGLATSKGLAALGATVHLLGRTPEKTRRAADEVAEVATGEDPVVENCDIADLAALREFTTGFTGDVGALDVLVHNAGVMPDERSETAQGHELAFATHVLAPMAMTEQLRTPLARARGARVVVVSSGGAYSAPLSLADPETERGEYRGIRVYARTKRMQLVLAELLAEELGDDGITVNAMHPGWADTPGVAGSLPGFRRLTSAVLRSLEQGADTAVWLAATPDLRGRTGLFWHDRRPRPTHFALGRDDPEERRRLWDYCREAIAAAG